VFGSKAWTWPAPHIKTDENLRTKLPLVPSRLLRAFGELSGKLEAARPAPSLGQTPTSLELSETLNLLPERMS